MSRKIRLTVIIFVMGILIISLFQPLPTTPIMQTVLDKNGEAMLLQTYGKFPLSFEVNTGQADSQVKFLSRGNGYSLFLMPTEAVLKLHKPADSQRQEAGLDSLDSSAKSASNIEQDILRMQFIGANPAPQMVGLEELPGQANYFIGNYPEKWHTNIPTYARVHYQDVYPGVDLIYYGNQGQLEYDFVIKSGADPKDIALSFTGADNLEITNDGNLQLDMNGELITLHKPELYQTIDGVLHEVVGSFILTSENLLGFTVGNYNRSHELIIDPILTYSTYLGGTSNDSGIAIALDTNGNAYIVGVTFSADIATANAYDDTLSGPLNAYITKLSADGSTILYSTYFGGNEDFRFRTIPREIAVDNSGNIYIAGGTSAPDFPVINAVQPTSGGSVDGFITKFSADGSELFFSTFLGGSKGEELDGLAIDASGNVYAAGMTYSTDFPIFNALQSTLHGITDAYVTKLNPSGSAFVYSTYLGGNLYDHAIGIAADSSGNAYVGGDTSSTDFPMVNAFQSTLTNQDDRFISKLNSAGDSLIYSTYFGGSAYAGIRDLAIDPAGSVYFTGEAWPGDFPTVNPIQAVFGGGDRDAYIVKINSAGSAIVYSTLLGGNGEDVGREIAVDTNGNAYVTGVTYSTNFPTVNPVQAVFGGYRDAFVVKINSAGTILKYSTYLGGSGDDSGSGIAVDSNGAAYVTGDTGSANFPTSNALHPTQIGSNDAFVVKISDVDMDIDTDGDGFLDSEDNAPSIYNPDQRDVDGDGTADVLDPCPADPTDSCNINGSTAGVIGAQGGTVTTANGKVVFDIPAGTVIDDTSFSITDMGGGYEVTVFEGAMTVISGYSIQPNGTEFDPPAVITFRWDDIDNDGIVDGTSLQEANIMMIKDGLVITSSCDINPNCDMNANELTLEVSSLSLFELAAPSNQPPLITSITAPVAPVQLGQGINATTTFSDPDVGDTHTVAWDWGDGSTTTGSSAFESHLYAQPGVYTIAVTVTDDGGLSDTDTATVTILPWTLKGFYQPVDMNNVYNIVKGGSTVPLKFEIFAGSTELTDVADIKSLTYAQTSCDASSITDEIETTATGGTSLRYEGGQFIYNWKTPKSAGKCYRVTMTTIDGSTLMAYFKLK